MIGTRYIYRYGVRDPRKNVVPECQHVLGERVFRDGFDDVDDDHRECRAGADAS